MSWVEDWTVVAACRGMDPDELFVQGAAQNRAKTVCSGCPVRTECLADALDNRVEYGVWGGMTERERRALLRRRPEVRSWRQFLESAKEKYERSGEVVIEPRFAAAAAAATPQAVIPRQRDEAGSFGRA
ncbi:MAG: WhiB family transcriptional regulator [Catenulispora sp.]|nr:WhiB family transcriptional regulator [Catenulispora sp.]